MYECQKKKIPIYKLEKKKETGVFFTFFIFCYLELEDLVLRIT